jgi:hypothetical protein
MASKSENGTVQDKPKRHMFIIGVPNDEIYDAVSNAAKASEVSPARYLLHLASQALGFDIPKYVRTRVSKYASDEERKAAVKASAAKRQDKINSMLALMQRIAKGETVSQEELLEVASK